MCSVISGGRLATSTTSNSNKSRNLEELSEGESNPDSPKMSKNEKTNSNKNSDLKNDADENLSVGSPGNIYSLFVKIYNLSQEKEMSKFSVYISDTHLGRVISQFQQEAAVSCNPNGA